jgi:putative hydrolase of the HAD superfamily
MFPYALEILEYLFNKKYTLHLITNGFEKTQWSKIKNSQIDHFFTHVITSEASNSMKPEKEIFEFALNKASAVANESIMIGDNLEADILGASNAGIDTIFVNHINAPQTIPSTFSITDLSQLKDIL